MIQLFKAQSMNRAIVLSQKVQGMCWMHQQAIIRTGKVHVMSPSFQRLVLVQIPSEKQSAVVLLPAQFSAQMDAVVGFELCKS